MGPENGASNSEPQYHVAYSRIYRLHQVLRSFQRRRQAEEAENIKKASRYGCTISAKGSLTVQLKQVDSQSIANLHSQAFNAGRL